MEIFLNVASFSISVGGLIAALVVRDNKRKAIVLGAVAAVLITTSGTALFLSYQHEKYVNRVQGEMIKILSLGAITLDDLYQNIFPPVSHKLLREALYEGVEEGLIEYRPIRLQNNGKTMSIKVFYAPQ